MTFQELAARFNLPHFHTPITELNMTSLQFVSLVLDILLVVTAVVAFWLRPRIGGQLALGLRVLMVGVMVLGLAHLIETMLFVIFSLSTSLNEVLHRLLVVGAMILVIVGFAIMRRAFEG
jgi:hypothetical protein